MCKIGDEVTAYWTNAGYNWSSHATVIKVNPKSYIVRLKKGVHLPPDDKYSPNALAYKANQDIKFATEDKWTVNNRLVLGYVPLDKIIDRTTQPKITRKTSKLKIRNSLYDRDSIDFFKQELRMKLKFPYVKIRISSLGGKDNLSIFVAISKDEPETWVNGIFENSRSAKIRIGNDGEIEQISGWKLKLRKSTVKDVYKAIEKINNIKIK